MSSVALIIPAAGSGERLNSSIPKPYIKVAGKTLLEHSLLRFISILDLQQVIVPTSADYVDVATSILVEALPRSLDFLCIEGGTERQHSIYNALNKTKAVDLVAVHDAVRPFIEPAVIKKCIRTATEIGGSVVGVPAKDTIKKVNNDQVITDTPERAFLWQTQTPQIFRRDILMAAYQRAEEEGFLGTDDSSLVERLGHPVKMVEGNRNNFKITYPIDLKLAKLLLEE